MNILIQIYFKLFSFVDRNFGRKQFIGKVFFQQPAGPVVDFFHAASVGEFETLLPLIRSRIQAHQKIAVTGFSPSLEKTFLNFLSDLGDEKNYLAFLGASPDEKDWKQFLIRYKPQRWITARYEIWPGLMLGLNQLKIPYVSVGAQGRGSLKFARHWLTFLKLHQVPLVLFPTVPEQETELKSLFPQALIQVRPDPRYFQIQHRLQNKNPKVALRIDAVLKGNSDGYFLLANAWPEDVRMAATVGFLKSKKWIIVPHVVEGAIYQKLLKELKKSGVKYCESKDKSEFYTDCLVINEIGLLLHLYSQAKFVWMGGGFTKTIHSLIEPSAFSAPIVCGPFGIQRFPEAKQLIQEGRLQVLNLEPSPLQIKEIENWLKVIDQRQFKNHEFTAQDLESWIVTLDTIR